MEIFKDLLARKSSLNTLNYILTRSNSKEPTGNTVGFIR